MSNYPEPTGELVARKKNSTTLDECGWCEYAFGLHRYNYCISGKCSLQNDYDDKEVHWDDKCFFDTASRSEIDSFIDRFRRDIKQSKESIKQDEKYIDRLEDLIGDAPYIPSLPMNRKYNHFEIGDDVAVFIEDRWYFGKVVPGYRHEDGCVSYVLRGFGPQDKDFWGCGVSVPIVMLKKEYDFFLLSPKAYKTWCKKAYAKDFNGQKLAVAPIKGE